MIKHSKQRDAIKNYLMTRKDHPTAEQIYNAVREEMPNISLGTVYRNLTLLADQNEIMRLSCGEGLERFDGNPERHYHFICNSCHSVIDLPIMNLDIVNAAAASGFDGEIQGHYIYFNGICKKCLGKDN